MLKQCSSRGAAVCVGIDPVFERLPAKLRAGMPSDAIEQFSIGVLDAVAEHVPAVKIQLACFERYGAAGFAAYEAVVVAAKKLDLLVIADAKRGDIGISAEHYAAGLLGSEHSADALTVNAYLGADALEPFVKLAASKGKGLFALVRTSNPGSAAIQSLALADGRSVAQAVGDVVGQLGSSQSSYIGARGYSLLGAVVGATQVSDIAALRKRMPEQIFLVPGFGAQGGSAENVKACFNSDGRGALITASRSVIYAFDADDCANWQEAVADSAADLKEQIRQIAGC